MRVIGWWKEYDSYFRAWVPFKIVFQSKHAIYITEPNNIVIGHEFAKFLSIYKNGRLKRIRKLSKYL